MANLSEELKEKMLNALEQAEHSISTAKFKVKDNLNLLEPINIMPYYGFGNDTYVYLKGRVLEDEKVNHSEKDKSVLTNLIDTYKRYESDEIPGIKLTAHFADQEKELKTDEEGFFEVEFRTDTSFDYNTTGHKVQLQLQEQKTDKDNLHAEAHIFVPGKEADFGIISDIDDTVLVSDATHFLGNLKLMLKNNATHRSPFRGVAGFLRALCNGSNGNKQNPLFFVSGSEWNLYDLLVSFFRSHDIPKGPLLLRDKGTRLDRGDFETSEQEYKLQKIRHILDTYPDLKFICIGDSGQHDLEVYEKTVQEYPGRIAGIYIRDVSKDGRDEEVRNMAQQMRAEGVEMELVEETLSAAQHAIEQGWINKEQLAEVRKACEKDEQPES